MAIKEAIKEQQFIKALINEISLSDSLECQTLYTDSNSALELAKNPVFHTRTKHIDIQYHYVRECVQNGLTRLIQVNTKGQLADALTKALPIDKQ